VTAGVAKTDDFCDMQCRNNAVSKLGFIWWVSPWKWLHWLPD